MKRIDPGKERGDYCLRPIQSPVLGVWIFLAVHTRNHPIIFYCSFLTRNLTAAGQPQNLENQKEIKKKKSLGLER